VILNLTVSALLMAVAVVPSAATSKTATNAHDFSRYQIILDRSPFSPPAGSADAPQPGFSTRFSFIGTAQMSTDAPVMAFIQDKQDNNRIYCKTEGESMGAATVVAISQSPRAKLVLKQGLETATLTLETKATVGPAPAMPNPEFERRPIPGVPPGVRRIPFRRGG